MRSDFKGERLLYIINRDEIEQNYDYIQQLNMAKISLEFQWIT